MSERPLSVVSAVDSLTAAANTPLPADDELIFREPRPPFLAVASAESPRESYVQSSLNDSGSLLAPKKEVDHEQVEHVATSEDPPKAKRRSLLIGLLLLGIILLILVIFLPVYFTVIKPKNATASSSSGGSSSGTGSHHGSATSTGTSPPPKPTEPTSGGDGSTVRATDGTTFTYNNKLGGIWVSDLNDPYGNAAYPNSWTPPLNQSWDFGKDRIFGVNLGGWFVLEPFISPIYFQKYPDAVDEWSLSTLMAADTASGGLNQLEDHYKTFITEQDIAEIAGAGLNWVRIPIPFWAVDKLPEEPFLEKVSWKYIVQALQWCRKYGLRVKLDLHTIPGSQNAYNHSGKRGQVNFLHGVMGIANAQRALNVIRIITEFISQPEWKDVVVIFGIMNEAQLTVIGDEQLRGFYVEAYKMMREITGLGAGNGPYISIHDSFRGLSYWAGFLQGSDRVAIDQHPYFAFSGGPATDPIDTGVGPGAGGIWPQAACDRWASPMNASRAAFGVSFAGEWSNGFNDCGLFLVPSSSYGGNCADWEDASGWTEGTKAGLMAFSSASMDAFKDWFFWTWKIGNSQRGIVETPLWSYQAGLRGGWMPTDPRSANGACGPSGGPVFDGTYEPWMTGGAGAGVIAAAQTAQYPYPPLNLADTPGPVELLPTYTPTGTIATLPVPTYTDTSGNVIKAGNGWFNAQDTQPAPTPIQGCFYPDPWNALTVPVPPSCAGTGLKRRSADPSVITPAPTL